MEMLRLSICCVNNAWSLLLRRRDECDETEELDEAAAIDDRRWDF
jgi:hypothetical protein